MTYSIYDRGGVLPFPAGEGGAKLPMAAISTGKRIFFPKRFTKIPLSQVFHKQKFLKDCKNASYDLKQRTKEEFKNSVYFYDQNSNREVHKIIENMEGNLEEVLFLEGIHYINTISYHLTFSKYRF